MPPELSPSVTAEVVSRPAARRQWFATQQQAERARQIGIVLVLGLGAVAMIVPFEWMLATSLSRTANMAMPRLPRLWPADPSLFNYQVAVTNIPLLRYYLNSFLVTTAATVGLLIFS